MRVDSASNIHNLHFHDGSTCHGFLTFRACVDNAKENMWEGKILRRVDSYKDGKYIRCFSLISGSFEHYKKQGKFVAEIKLQMKVIKL